MLNLPAKKIRLNDNSELEVKWCGAAEGILWADGVQLDFIEAARIFSDIEKTAKIIAPNGDMFEGYVALIHISESEGAIKVALRKEL